MPDEMEQDYEMSGHGKSPLYTFRLDKKGRVGEFRWEQDEGRSSCDGA